MLRFIFAIPDAAIIEFTTGVLSVRVFPVPPVISFEKLNCLVFMVTFTAAMFTSPFTVRVAFVAAAALETFPLKFTLVAVSSVARFRVTAFLYV